MAHRLETHLPELRAVERGTGGHQFIKYREVIGGLDLQFKNRRALGPPSFSERCGLALEFLALAATISGDQWRRADGIGVRGLSVRTSSSLSPRVSSRKHMRIGVRS